MKNFKYILFLCLLWLPFSVGAKKYDVTNYYIDVSVNKNNTYNIAEYYNVLFFDDANYVRKIQLRPKVYLTDGKFISYITEVSNINSESPLTTKKDSKKYEISFPSSYKNNSETYVLSYQYNMGNDLDNDKDIVFVNIVDGTFDELAYTTSFSVTLPVDADIEGITFFKNGDVLETDKVIYTHTENYIEGTISEEIKKGDIISIRLTLPNGYFKNTIRTDSNTSYLLLILPIIAVGLGIFGLTKYQRTKIKHKENILELASTFDSAEMAYLYRGSINASDLISLLFCLANEGYIVMKNYGSKDKVYFKIKKVKEYDKDNAAQKIIFDGLFQNRDEIDIHGIEGVFFPYYNDAKRTLQNNKNHKKLFYKYAKALKFSLLLTTYIGLFFLQIKPLYNILDSYTYAVIESVIVSLIILFRYHSKHKLLKYGLSITSLAVIVIQIYALLDFKLNMAIYCIGIILSEITLFIENKIPVRTVYGTQMLYEIEKFRLEVAGMSEEVFNAKVEENPNYFFEMIPYMIIFDLHSWWFNRFGNKIENPPTWYESSETYTAEKLNGFMTQCIHQLIVPVQTTQKYADELLQQAPNKLL